VPVTWRSPEAAAQPDPAVIRGAEARVSFDGDRVIKHRQPRSYRHPALDERLRRRRTRREARLTSKARRVGVPTPLVRDVDPAGTRLVLQRVGERDLREAPTEERIRTVARLLARLHGAGIVHGDPTVRNVRVDPVVLIDFGLGYESGHPEDHAMDLHVFAGSLEGTTDGADLLVAAAVEAYREAGDARVLDRLAEIEGRGRYR
jgi:N6-L-threonylcarbamoyladenine synthase/protein kinase Bud32